MGQEPAGSDNLRRFDLNPLVAFEVLMSERSVTAAARRLGVGQPAMSNALSRLRTLFQDALLVRTPTGLQPTGRALDLATPVSRILAELRREVFNAKPFDPAGDRRTFRIGLSDHAEAAIMQSVLRTVGLSAPLPSPGYDVRMVWHPRTASDPAQIWLRELITSIGRTGS